MLGRRRGQKLRPNEVMYSARKFCGFLRGFFKSPLKQGPLTAVPTYFDKIKNADVSAFFVCALNVGAVRPKPGHKGLFVKSPLESQKLCQDKLVCSRGSSLANLSEGKGVRIFIHYNCIKSRQGAIFIIGTCRYWRQKTKSNESSHCFFAYAIFVAAIFANI